MVEREVRREAAGPAARARASRVALLGMGCHHLRKELKAGRASQPGPRPCCPAPIGPGSTQAAAPPAVPAGVPAAADGAAAAPAEHLVAANLVVVATVRPSLRAFVSAAGFLAASMKVALQLSLVAPVQVQHCLQLLDGHFKITLTPSISMA